jgi:glycosyltransferase involved in cell wall biosynthesis
MKILIYPKARSNPYHELLYGELKAAHPEAKFTYISAGIATAILPFMLLFRRLQGYDIFHLHWHGFYAPFETRLPSRGYISLWNTLWSLHLIKWLGFKLVWTVHNVLPHVSQTRDDARVVRVTANLAEALIIHSSHTADQLRGLGADISRATVIPHGNYDGVYPVTLDRDEARARLGIQPEEAAILFFGNIRPYKGIEDGLLPAFEHLDATTKNLRLIIAGKCYNAGLQKTIAAFVQKHPNVMFPNIVVPDEDVAAYFEAADVVCLPFKAITTSGSIILAATFGKPLVAPRMGAIKDIPTEVGVLYDPATNDALLHALEKALASKAALASMGKTSRAYADTLAWSKLAAKTYTVYQGSLANGK